MGSLFEQVAREHGVPVGLVSAALGRNRARIDVAVNLPFVLLTALLPQRWPSCFGASIRLPVGFPESHWPCSFLWRSRPAARCLERYGPGLQKAIGSAMHI